MNARHHPPDEVARSLAAVATSPRLAMVVDVDALTRSQSAVDRMTLLALDALSHAGVQVAIVVEHATEYAAAFRRGQPRVWCFEQPGDHATVIARVRDRLPGARVIAISDDRTLLATLGETDRVLAIPRERAALWWLVEVRSKRRTNAP